MDSKTEKTSITGSGSARLAALPEGRLSLSRIEHRAMRTAKKMVNGKT
jgi:hypothetical protein